MSTISESQRSLPMSLRKNFTWTFVGNVIYSGCSWAILIVLAKLGTPEIVGQFALGLAVTTPIIAFANLQLRAVQATDAQHQYLFRDYWGLRLIMLGLALVVICGIVVLSGYQRELMLTVLVIGFGKAVDAISDVIYGLLQKHEQMDRVSVSLILKGILSLIMLAIPLYVTHSVLWAAIGWVLASVVVVVTYDLRSAVIMLKIQSLSGDSLYPHFDLRRLGKLAWLALPLGITLLLISLMTNIPSYFLQRFAGDRALGIFAAMAYLIVAGTTVTSALGQAASPRLAKQYAANEERQFHVLLLRLAIIGALLGAAGVLTAVIGGRLLLTLFYQPEYAAYNDVFILLMIGGGISYVASLSGYAITAARYFKLQPVIFTLGVASTLILCFLLIPSQGIRGAAWVSVMVGVIQLVLTLAYLAYALYKLHQRKLQG
jgi:O-antigen/teichoic acid export membrane protein